jgi:hypothetical protein
MLKLNVPLRRCTVQVEAETQVGLFEQWAAAVEVFGEHCCGLCHNENIVPVVRTVVCGKQEYQFHELQCQNAGCRARLSYGVHLGGETLFPHRRLDAGGRPDRAEGEYGPHGGWTRYKGTANVNGNGKPEAAAPADGRNGKPAAVAVRR